MREEVNAKPNHRWLMPDAWCWTVASEIAQIVGGGTPSTRDQRNFDGGKIPWITPADLTGYREKMIRRGERNITEKGLSESGARVMPAGTVLFSSRAPIGYVAIADNPVATNQGFKSFIPNEAVTSDYLYYYMQFAKPIAKEMASGTTFLEISGAKAAQIPIPVAPVEEQKQIVAEIEKQFTRLDAATAALKRVQANLKRYRASVLKAACEGRLVPTEAELARKEGRDYEPADKLLQRILRERRARWEADTLAKMQASGKPPKDDHWKQKYKVPAAPDIANLPELPEGWCWASLEQISFFQNGRPFPSSQYQAEGMKLLRPGNLYASGDVRWDEKNTRCLPMRYADENRDLIVGGHELVMNLTAQSLKDEFLGRICMTAANDISLLNQRLARITPVLISSSFLLCTLKSWRFRRFVDGLNTGSLIQHMFTSQLSDFAVALPPLAEQSRITEAVEKQVSVISAQEGSAIASEAKLSAAKIHLEFSLHRPTRSPGPDRRTRLPRCSNASAPSDPPLPDKHPSAAAERSQRMLKGKTTQPGHVNRNSQVVIRNTGLCGTDHVQTVYELKCSHCGCVYGANGSDIFQRKCPECQGGAKGLDLTT